MGRHFLAWTVGIKKIIHAVFANKFITGAIEGELQRIPADFLIALDGIIIESYYGKDIGDHLPINQLLNTARSYSARNRKYSDD